MPCNPSFIRLRLPVLGALAVSLALAGCTGFTNPFAPAAPPAAPDLQQIQQVMAVTEVAAATQSAVTDSQTAVTDSAVQTVPTVQGVGYAVVSAQQGKSLTHRRLMAIRVARLEAMRELTEKVHGLQLAGNTSVADAIIQSDTIRASVSGTIRGARTVRIEPKGSDTYEVILELDRGMIEELLRAARRVG